MSFAKVTIFGNLGRDPETRYTPNGALNVQFSMAADGRPKQGGEKSTTWFRVTAWRKLAETASQYLTKGSKVLVVGELEDPNAYIDREGQARASLEVTAQTIRFLSTRGEGGSAPVGAGGSAAADNSEAMSDEDIPF